MSDGPAPSDTSPEVERRYRELLLSRSGVERMRLGADMFQAARELALAGLRADGVPEQELLPRLFLRFHGHELPPEVCAAVVARLRTLAAPRERRR